MHTRAWCDKSDEYLQLVFVDLDGAEGAFFHALAALIAGILVDYRSGASDDVEHAVGACVNADTTSRAFVSIDIGLGHGSYAFRLGFNS